MPPVLRLLRPRQWTKNLLVFAALLFANRMGDPEAVARAVLAFVAMALVSSAVYVANDLVDRDRDRRHPVKRRRPLAAGEVSPATARVLIAALAVVGLGIAAGLGRGAIVLVLLYVGVQVAYNLKLKAQPVADVFALASGFVIRAVLGAVAIRVGISAWLLLCTGALSLMVGVGKRRHEFRLMEGEGGSRGVLEHYTQTALDQMLVASAAIAAIGYGVYSIDSETAHRYPGLVLTSFWVLYGTFRYLYLVFAQGEGGEPEAVLFRDRHLQVTFLGFLATAAVAISGWAPRFIVR